MEGTNVRPGSQLLTWIHDLEVNTVDNAYLQFDRNEKIHSCCRLNW